MSDTYRSNELSKDLAATEPPLLMHEHELSAETMQAIKAIMLDGEVQGAPAVQMRQALQNDALLDPAVPAPAHRYPVKYSPRILSLQLAPMQTACLKEELVSKTMDRQPEPKEPSDARQEPLLLLEPIVKAKPDIGAETKTAQTAADSEARTIETEEIPCVEITETRPHGEGDAASEQMQTTQELTSLVREVTQEVTQAAQVEAKAQDAGHNIARTTSGQMPASDGMTSKRTRKSKKRAAKARTPRQPSKIKRVLTQKLWPAVKHKTMEILPDDETLLRVLTPRRIAIVVIIAAILLEPWFLPTVFILLAFFGGVTAFVMGPDRLRHYSEVVWKYFSRRKPEKAAAVRSKAMRHLERTQSKLDRLPSKWTGAVHLPQLQSDEDRSRAETAYARRMARMAQDESRQTYS